MTDIEKKALALVTRLQEEDDGKKYSYAYHFEALCRAIEQHEAFKREVSDAVTGFDEYGTEAAWERLSRFIIAKPDPLVEVLQEISGEGGYDNFDHYAYRLRSALEARDLEIREKQP